MKVSSFVRPAFRASMALTALVTAACPPSPVEPPRGPQPAIIELSEGDPVRVELPATATAGAPFDVRVTSYGGGCRAKGPTTVSVSGSTALVEPIQLVPVEDGLVCTMELRIDQNTASVRFDAPGAARVVVRGYSSVSRQMITVERTVQVR